MTKDNSDEVTNVNIPDKERVEENNDIQNVNTKSKNVKNR